MIRCVHAEMSYAARLKLDSAARNLARFRSEFLLRVHAACSSLHFAFRSVVFGIVD